MVERVGMVMNGETNGDIREQLAEALEAAHYTPPEPPPAPIAPTKTPITLRVTEFSRDTYHATNKELIVRARGDFRPDTALDVAALHTGIRDAATSVLRDHAEVTRWRGIRGQLVAAKAEATKLIDECRAAKDAVVVCEREAGQNLGPRLVALTQARDALLQRSGSLSAEIAALEGVEMRARETVANLVEASVKAARIAAAQEWKTKEAEAMATLEKAIRDAGPRLFEAEMAQRKCMEGTSVIRTPAILDALLLDNSATIEV